MPKTQDRGLSIISAIDTFLLDCAARRLTRQTRAGYKRKLGVVLRWCEQNQITYVTELTTTGLRRFMVELADRNLSGQYQHNIARSLKAFLNFCVREGILEHSPFDRLRMPKLPQHDIEFFNPTEIAKVFKACKTERDLALCAFLLDTGLRASEAIAVHIGDVNLPAGRVHVMQGKGQKDRTVYIGAKTRRYIARYLRRRPGATDREPLFASRSGERLTLDGLVQIMRRLQARSGVKKCRAHTFRRTFAVNCLRNGMNVYIVAKLMGHADITMLKRYLAFLEQDLQGAHERYGVVDNL